MNTILRTFAVAALLLGLVAAQNDSPPAGVTATQSLRTSWTSNGDTYYLYDITLTNGGSSTLEACGLLYLIDYTEDSTGNSANPSSDIRITQDWNLIEYATAGGPPHAEFGPQPTLSLAPGQSDSGSGYVVADSQTTLTLLYDASACSNSSSSNQGSGSTGSSAPSGTTSGSSTPSSTGNSGSSCSSMSISQSLQNSWNTGSQWTVTVTNRGSSAITSLDLVTIDSARITQIWSVTSTGNGHYTFPSYTTSLAAGASLTFGYVSTDANLVSFSVQVCGSASAAASSGSSQASTGSSSPSTTGSSSSSGCSASVDTVGTFESLNKWSDGTYNYIQYQLSVTNTGSSTLTSASAFIYFTQSYGEISQQWNMAIDDTEESGDTVTISAFNLAPGQTFTGAGFVFKYAIANEDDSEYSHSHYTLPYAVAEKSAQC